MHPARLWFKAQKIEEYTLKSYDNKKLKGYMIRNNSNKVAFLIHAYRGRYYSLAIQAKMFYQAGYMLMTFLTVGIISQSGLVINVFSNIS